MLCAVPALRALRAARPDAHITLIGLPWARVFAGRYDAYVDDFIASPGLPGLPERAPEPERVPEFLRDVQRRRFDLAIQLHGSGRLTNAVVARFGAKRIAGFHEPGAYRSDDGDFLPWPTAGHEVHRLLRLVELLGAPPQGDHLEFPIREADGAELRAFGAVGHLAPYRYACVHPGARHAVKRWAPERFAVVADALAARGLRVVLTGTAAEAPLTRAVAAAMRAPALDAAGPMSLGALAALLAGARLLVCNDTGVSHLAAALGTPSVVVFLAADPDRWAPLDRVRHRPVYGPGTAGGRGGRGASDVTPGVVLDEIDRLPMPERAHAA